MKIDAERVNSINTELEPPEKLGVKHFSIDRSNIRLKVEVDVRHYGDGIISEEGTNYHLPYWISDKVLKVLEECMIRLEDELSNHLNIDK